VDTPQKPRAERGLPPAIDLSEAFEITRSLPHGHVAAVLGNRTAQTGHRRKLIDPGPRHVGAIW